MTTVEDWLGKDNALGISIWEKKYRHGNETFDDWLDRVSGKDKDVRRLILEKKFLFGGRILSNRGLDSKSTMSNCYVLSADDNIRSIYQAASDMAMTYKAGGGCGIDISKLAPNGASVNNPAKTSSGAVSFIELFTTTTGLIGQNGRRGALMISIDCKHPDVEEFIDLKTDVNKATTANLSIRASNDFMESVIADKMWTMSFQRPETGQTITKIVRAKDLFQKLCDANYDYGEPGLLFWDNIKEYNMLDTYDEFKFAGINPCGELPLPAGGACLLGSMNLAEYVIGDSFAIEKFKNDVAIAIKALDTVQDEGISRHPLEIQQQTARDWKQLGLGIMGLGDMLIKMNIKYGSEESLALCNEIADALAKSAIIESAYLGDHKGSFPKFNADKTMKSEFMLAHAQFNEPLEAMRNSQLLAIAPTGTISTMLGVSGGIEPLYALEFERTTKSLHGKDKTYKVIPKVVEEARKAGHTNGLVCANDIDYFDRLKMQSVWQRHIDGSISSTINLPHDFPKEKIYEIYTNAWRYNLKGVTVFRDGCKREGVLSTKPKTDVIEPEELVGYKRKVTVGCGTEHVCIYVDKDGNPRELFIAKGSTGGCTNTLTGLSRLTSLALRNDIPLEKVLDQLESCGVCPSYAVRRATKKDVSKGACCPSALANVIKDVVREAKGERAKQSDDKSGKCPECGAPLIADGGCNICKSCGWSKCA